MEYKVPHRTEIAVLVLRKGYSTSGWLWDFCYYINQVKQTQPFSRPISIKIQNLATSFQPCRHTVVARLNHST